MRFSVVITPLVSKTCWITTLLRNGVTYNCKKFYTTDQHIKHIKAVIDTLL
jgi:hypothetical protein